MNDNLPQDDQNNPMTQPAMPIGGSTNNPKDDSSTSASPLQQPQQPPAPQPPGGGIAGKEREVLGSGEAPIEVLKEPEQLVSAELKEAGVEIRPTTIELPPDLKKLGVQPGASGMPIVHQASLQGTGPVALPLTDGEIMAAEKIDASLSLRWLAIWCFRQIMKAGFHLKIVHGKIFRVKLEKAKHAE